MFLNDRNRLPQRDDATPVVVVLSSKVMPLLLRMLWLLLLPVVDVDTGVGSCNNDAS